MQYTKEQQLSIDYKEIMMRRKSGKRVRMIVGNCNNCGKHYEKKKNGNKNKNLCQVCSRKEGWKKHKGQIHHVARTGEYKKCKLCEKELAVNYQNGLLNRGRINANYLRHHVKGIGNYICLRG